MKKFNFSENQALYLGGSQGLILETPIEFFDAYHEGWGNYKYYKKNKKVIGLAKKVEKQSKIYRKQLVKCSNKLNKNKYIIF